MLSGLHSLDGYHTALRRRAIARLLSVNGFPYSYSKLELLDDMSFSGGTVVLSQSKYAVCDGNSVRIDSVSRTRTVRRGNVMLHEGKNIIDSNTSCFVTVRQAESSDFTRNINTNSTHIKADYDKIKGKVFIRSRENGDKLRLCGRSFTSRVKTLLNASVPKERRSELCFAADDEGLFFVEEIGLADRVRITSETKKIMEIQFTRTNTAESGSR